MYMQFELQKRHEKLGKLTATLHPENTLELQGPVASIDVFSDMVESATLIFKREHVETLGEVKPVKVSIERPSSTSLRLTGEWSTFEEMLKQYGVEINKTTQGAALEV